MKNHYYHRWNQPVYKAGRNLPGVEVVQVQSLNAEHLAQAGRLTIWTESAVNARQEGWSLMAEKRLPPTHRGQA